MRTDLESMTDDQLTIKKILCDDEVAMLATSCKDLVSRKLLSRRQIIAILELETKFLAKLREILEV